MKSPFKVFFKVIGFNLLSIMLKQTNRIVLLPVKPFYVFFIGAKGGVSHASRYIATNSCQSQLEVKRKHLFRAFSTFSVLCSSSNVKMPSCSDKAATTVASTLISLAVASRIFFVFFWGFEVQKFLPVFVTTTKKLIGYGIS